MERLTEGRYTCGQGCKFDSGTSKGPQWFECRMRWSIWGPANRNGIFRVKELMCGDLYLVKWAGIHLGKYDPVMEVEESLN